MSLPLTRSYDLNQDATFQVTWLLLSYDQKITLTGASGGTFQLIFRGSTTVPIAYNATAQAVQDALNNLPTIGPYGGVSVAGTAGAWVVTFSRELKAGSPQRLGYTTALTGAGTVSLVPDYLPQDLTGYTALCQVRDTRDINGVRRFNITNTLSADGQVQLGGAAGTVTLVILRAAIDALQAAPILDGAKLYGDVEIVDTGGAGYSTRLADIEFTYRYGTNVE